MWCIGEITAEYRRRMYDLLDLYARPYDAREPVICLDEKSKQLLKETRDPLPAKPETVAKEDYEYERAGTCNIFFAGEPRGQRRLAQVTARRTKVDFVGFVCRMLRNGYSHARKVHTFSPPLSNFSWRVCGAPSRRALRGAGSLSCWETNHCVSELLLDGARNRGRVWGSYEPGAVAGVFVHRK